MRTKHSFLFSTILAFLLLASNNNLAAQDTADSPQELIKILMGSAEVAILRAGGRKLVIMTTNYCAEHDCPPLFAHYSDQVVFYSKEEGFMRKISGWIEVTDLSTTEKYIAVKYKNGEIFKQLTYHSKH